MQEGNDYNSFDFEFFVAVSSHPRLNIKNAVQILDVLGKIYVNDFRFTTSSCIPFMMITTRFINAGPLHEYVRRFISYGVKLIVSSVVSEMRKTRKEPGEEYKDFTLE